MRHRPNRDLSAVRQPQLPQDRFNKHLLDTLADYARHRQMMQVRCIACGHTSSLPLQAFCSGARESMAYSTEGTEVAPEVPRVRL